MGESDILTSAVDDSNCIQSLESQVEDSNVMCQHSVMNQFSENENVFGPASSGRLLWAMHR